MHNKAVPIAGIIFAILSIIHLARLLCPFEVSIAGMILPVWASGVFFVLGGLLAAWLFRIKEVPQVK